MVAHEWGVQIPADYWVGAGALTETGEGIIRNLHALNASARVAGSLGRGLIEFAGAKAVDDPCLTIWRYRIFGGVSFADDHYPHAFPNSEYLGDQRASAASRFLP